MVVGASGTGYGYQNLYTGVGHLAHHFIIDRCWFDGGASDTSQMHEGLQIAADYTSVVDSYLAYFRLIGAGADSDALSVIFGQGPHSFVNNFMSATSESVNHGGGSSDVQVATISNATTTSCTLTHVTNLEVDQNIALQVNGLYSAVNSTIVRSISGNNITFDSMPNKPTNGNAAEWTTTPSFIEYRHNYFFKPNKWRPKLANGSANPEWNGITYQIKNLWEMKTGRYLVLDGNIFENLWVSSQSFAIAFSPSNIWGGSSHAVVAREIQYSNNILKNAVAGLNLRVSDVQDTQDRTTQAGGGFYITNNLFWNVGHSYDQTGTQHEFVLLGTSPVKALDRVFIIHNTQEDPDGVGGQNGYFMTDNNNNNVPTTNGMWVNNLQLFNGGFIGHSGVDYKTNIEQALPPGDVPGTFWNNLLVNFPVNDWLIVVPANQIYQGSQVSPISWPAQFVNYAAGDFTLTAGSRGKNAATDGTDIGVNMAALKTATSGAVSGIWMPISATRPRTVSK